MTTTTTTTTTARTLTTYQVSALREEALSSGDMIQVVICDMASNAYDADDGLEAYDGLNVRAAKTRLSELGIAFGDDGVPRASSGSLADSAESIAWAECARVIADAEAA